MGEALRVLGKLMVSGEVMSFGGSHYLAVKILLLLLLFLLFWREMGVEGLTTDLLDKNTHRLYQITNSECHKPK